MDIEAYKLLNKALELEQSLQESYLRKQCLHDAELLARCLALLKDQVDGGQSGNQAADENLAVMDDDSLRELLLGALKPENSGHDLCGKSIGNYRIQRKIGSGASAEVFLAYRNDDIHHHPVALKIIRGWGDTNEVMARMKRERKILSQFNHPNIANFLDGGNAIDGRPYFALEYVEGLPITDYAHQNNLNLRERIKLFLKVCSAIDAAHAKLTLHRDIKPSNIIVTKDGAPKLLDFGIAKILDEGVEDGTKLTEFYAPMTPQYASPEQVNQVPLSVASDQYSLGVLLYELICDQLPHESTENKIISLAQNKHVKRPSEKIRESQNLSSQLKKNLLSQVKGDLDAIVLKAINSDPSKRYGSVKEFAEDLKRFLQNKTVSAQTDTLCYRAGLFFKRNKVASSVVTAVTSFAIFSAVYFQVQLLQERDIAVTEREKFEQSQQFLLSLFRYSHPEANRKKEVTVREVLDHGVDSIKSKFTDKPRVKVALLTAMAQAYQDLQLTDEAIALHEQSLQIHQQFGENNSERSILESQALNLTALADLLIEKGGNTKAEKYISEAIAIYHKIGDPSRSANFKVEHLADAYTVAGKLSHRLGDYDEAIEYTQKSLAIWLTQGANFETEVVRCYMLLGVIYTGKGDYHQAQRYNQKALNLKLKSPEKDLATTSSIYNTIAVIYHYQAEYQNALENYQRSVDIRIELFGSKNSTLVIPYNNIGEVYTTLGDFDKAIQYHEMSLDILQVSDNSDLYYLAVTHNRLGDALAGKHSFDSAERHLQMSLDIRKKIYDEDHHDLAKSYDSFGTLMALKGNNSGAATYYQQALRIRENAYGYQHLLTKQTKSKLHRLKLP